MTDIIVVCTVKKNPDDGQRNCPKHVEFYSKNKIEQLVHLVGFIIRIYHDARSPERQIQQGSTDVALSPPLFTSQTKFYTSQVFFFFGLHWSAKRNCSKPGYLLSRTKVDV